MQKESRGEGARSSPCDVSRLYLRRYTSTVREGGRMVRNDPTSRQKLVWNAEHAAQVLRALTLCPHAVDGHRPLCPERGPSVCTKNCTCTWYACKVGHAARKVYASPKQGRIASWSEKGRAYREATPHKSTDTLEARDGPEKAAYTSRCLYTGRSPYIHLEIL